MKLTEQALKLSVLAQEKLRTTNSIMQKILKKKLKSRERQRAKRVVKRKAEKEAQEGEELKKNKVDPNEIDLSISDQDHLLYPLLLLLHE